MDSLSGISHSWIVDDGVPTCIDFLASDPNHMMAAYTSGNAYIFDLVTGQRVTDLQSRSAGKHSFIDCLRMAIGMYQSMFTGR